MKVITEEMLKKRLHYLSLTTRHNEYFLIVELIDECKEIDTLTVKEQDLILAAEKYSEKYEGDDRQDIKTDVLNAFYHGADWQRKKELAGNGNSEHKA